VEQQLPIPEIGSENEAAERPIWQTPTVTLLEIESGTLTSGAAAAEFGFTSS
jgi:hypothetical protein